MMIDKSVFENIWKMLIYPIMLEILMFTKSFLNICSLNACEASYNSLSTLSKNKEKIDECLQTSEHGDAINIRPISKKIRFVDSSIKSDLFTYNKDKYKGIGGVDFLSNSGKTEKSCLGDNKASKITGHYGNSYASIISQGQTKTADRETSVDSRNFFLSRRNKFGYKDHTEKEKNVYNIQYQSTKSNTSQPKESNFPINNSHLKQSEFDGANNNDIKEDESNPKRKMLLEALSVKNIPKQTVLPCKNSSSKYSKQNIQEKKKIDAKLAAFCSKSKIQKNIPNETSYKIDSDKVNTSIYQKNTAYSKKIPAQTIKHQSNILSSTEKLESNKIKEKIDTILNLMPKFAIKQPNKAVAYLNTNKSLSEASNGVKNKEHGYRSTSTIQKSHYYNNKQVGMSKNATILQIPELNSQMVPKRVNIPICHPFQINKSTYYIHTGYLSIPTYMPYDTMQTQRKKIYYPNISGPKNSIKSNTNKSG